jgi:hypothetical protein
VFDSSLHAVSFRLELFLRCKQTQLPNTVISITENGR